MTRSSQFLVLLLVALLAGCSTSQDVVGKGPFQKRKHRPGWDLSSLRMRKTTPPRAIRDPQQGSMKMDHRQVWPSAEPVRAAPLSASTTTVPISKVPPRTQAHQPRFDHVRFGIERSELKDVQPNEESITTGRRWNRMALVSGAFLLLSAITIAVTGGGEILLYLLSFAFITGIIGLVLAIKHNEKGKLIAIAGIALPLIVVALAIAALNSAF